MGGEPPFADSRAGGKGAPKRAVRLSWVERVKSTQAAVRSASCLPIMKVWNYTVRLFLPRSEILDGMDIPQGTACELSRVAQSATR
jgi:hypothetical protein